MSRIIKPKKPGKYAVSKFERSDREEIISGDNGRSMHDPAVILARAREEAERTLHEAYSEGLQKGIEDAKVQFRDSVGESAQMLTSAAKTLEKARQEFLDEIEPQMVQLAAVYTVLVEADDMNDAVADSVRSILDGDVVLSGDLASGGRYPAVDILESVSRLMIDVTEDRHQQVAQKLRRVLAVYRDAEDLVNIGAYVKGSNPEIDDALRLMPKIRQFLQQGLFETSTFDRIVGQMEQIFA